jgi:hypothetical protein
MEFLFLRTETMIFLSGFPINTNRLSNVLAWIEGTVNGKFRKIEFPYSREKLN